MTRRSEQLLTVNRSEFHILLSLADAERHGYGIMQDVQERSRSAIKLGPGTLYTAIKRMLASGLIEESEKRPAAHSDDGRRRCYYRLTGHGREVAGREAERLAELVQIARERKLLDSPLVPRPGEA